LAAVGEDSVDVLGFVPDLVVGEAQRGEARGRVRLVAEGVTSLGGRGAVIAPSVGLDHQAEVGPVEVDLEAVDDLFGERGRETGSCGERAKQDLELAVGEAKGEAVEQSAQWLDARLPRVVVERLSKGLGIDHVVLVRLVHHPLEPVRRQFRRPVDHGPDRRRDRDSEALGDITLQQAGPLPRLDPRPQDAAATPDGDVDRAVTLGADPPERDGASVAQHGPLAADENRRHPALLAVRQRPSHGVDTPSDGTETTRGEAVANRLRTETKPEKIPPSDHPVLSTRQRPGVPIPRHHL